MSSQCHVKKSFKEKKPRRLSNFFHQQFEIHFWNVNLIFFVENTTWKGKKQTKHYEKNVREVIHTVALVLRKKTHSSRHTVRENKHERKRTTIWPHWKPVKSVNFNLNFNNRFNSMVIDWHYAFVAVLSLSLSLSLCVNVYVKWPENEKFDALLSFVHTFVSHHLHARKYVLTWKNWEIWFCHSEQRDREREQGRERERERESVTKKNEICYVEALQIYAVLFFRCYHHLHCFSCYCVRVLDVFNFWNMVKKMI